MKKLLFGLLAGALLMTAIPAVADHPEPDRPVEGLYLYVYQYTSRDSTQATAQQCADGTAVFTSKSVRIEPYVVVPRYPGDSRDAPTPSEHFTLSTSRKAPIDGRHQGIGGNSWNHQNVPPHARMSGTVKGGDVPFAGALPGPDFMAWEADQSNMTLRPFGEGLFSVKYVVIGDESGNRFEVTCRFRYEEPAE